MSTLIEFKIEINLADDRNWEDHEIDIVIERLMVAGMDEVEIENYLRELIRGIPGVTLSVREI